MPWYVVIPLGLVAGGVSGALNGFGITKGNLQPFIITLGMMVIARGVTMTYFQGQPKGLIIRSAVLLERRRAILVERR